MADQLDPPRVPDPAGVVLSDPDIAGGGPIFRCTRAPVAMLFDHLKDGVPPDEILASLPTLDRHDVLMLLHETSSLVVGQDLRRAAA